jgi:hypothetical protein
VRFRRRWRTFGADERDRLRDEARAALVEMVIDRRDLLEAMRSFGDSFEEAAFAAAFHRRREDVAAAKLVNQLLWPLTSVVNQMNTVLSSSVVLGNLRKPGQADAMPGVYAALRDAGVITPQEAQEFGQLNAARNSLEHRYGLLANGGEVHTAARLAVGLLDRFGKDFGGWLRQAGVVDPPAPRPEV